MTTKPNPALYTPLPNEPHPNPTQNYVVLPLYPHRRRNRYPNGGYLLPIFSLLIITLSLYLLYPSNPSLQLVRVELNHIRVNSSPSLSLDLSLSLTLRVSNRDFWSLNYESLSVSIGYRGRELGFVKSKGGKLKARGSSYVNATLDVDGFEVLHDFVYLISDIAAGSVPFDTVSMIEGKLGLFMFKLPIKGKVSCEVHINPMNQTIIHQNCYPE